PHLLLSPSKGVGSCACNAIVLNSKKQIVNSVFIFIIYWFYFFKLVQFETLFIFNQSSKWHINKLYFSISVLKKGSGITSCLLFGYVIISNLFASSLPLI